MKACEGQSGLVRPPVWFMRQAGRYLPEYRAIREKVSFLELCRSPELAAEVSLQPVDLLGVDAAIIFSDILLPLADFGFKVDFPDKGGIKIGFDLSAVKLKSFQAGMNVEATCQAITLLKGKLKDKGLEVPVLGFAGAPWTLANYIFEGGSAQGGEFKAAKKTLWTNPNFVKDTLDELSEMTIVYLKSQINAGADAVQLFDTWAGELAQDDFHEYVLPQYKRIFQALPKTTPKILFIRGVAPYLEAVASVGADVLSLDWKVDLTDTWNKLKSINGNTIRCLQGNLDPFLLTSSAEAVKHKTLKIIEAGRSLSGGHILNLGHGVTPDANLNAVKAFVEASKSYNS